MSYPTMEMYKAIHVELLAAKAEVERLREALSWIEEFEPNIVDLARTKWRLK